MEHVAVGARTRSLVEVGTAEPPVSHDRFRLHVIGADRAPGDDAVLAACLRLRADFVRQMGWFDGLRDDSDRYDADPTTLHFALTAEPDQRVAAAMRLTRVPSVGSSLSWAMLSPEMAGAAATAVDDAGRNLVRTIDEAAGQGQAWDLTRLVNPMDGSVARKEILGGLIQMLAAGMQATLGRSDAPGTGDTYWFFTTTAPMQAAVQAVGIRHTVLARGRISPTDSTESCFCVGTLLAAYDVIMNDPKYAFARTHALEGLHKATATG